MDENMVSEFDYYRAERDADEALAFCEHDDTGIESILVGRWHQPVRVCYACKRVLS